MGGWCALRRGEVGKEAPPVRMAACNLPRRRRGLPRVARRVGGGGHPSRPTVGAGRAARRASGAEPLQQPREGRRRQPLFPRVQRLVRGETRRPVAACAAAPRRVGPRARQGAAARARAAPRIVSDGHGAAGAWRRGLRATLCHVCRAVARRGGGRGTPPPARRGVSPRRPRRHHRRRPADSGEAVGRRTRWQSPLAVRVVV